MPVAHKQGADRSGSEDLIQTFSFVQRVSAARLKNNNSPPQNKGRALPYQQGSARIFCLPYRLFHQVRICHSALRAGNRKIKIFKPVVDPVPMSFFRRLRRERASVPAYRISSLRLIVVLTHPLGGFLCLAPPAFALGPA